MLIAKTLGKLLRTAISIAANNDKKQQSARAVLVDGSTISVGDHHMALRLKLPASLAPTMPGRAFSVPVATLKAALKKDARNLAVELDGDLSSLRFNGIPIDTKEALKAGGQYSPPGLALDTSLTTPAYEPATLSRTFYKNLGRVSPAMGRKDIREYFNGLAFDFKRCRIIATDGHRMHMCNGDTLPRVHAMADAGIMVLRHEAVELIAALKPTTVSTWLPVLQGTNREVRQPGLFVFSGTAEQGLTWELTVSELPGSFPEVDHVVPPPYAMRRSIALRQATRCAWTVGVPTQVVIPNYADTLERYAKAVMKSNGRKSHPLVIVNLEAGELVNPDDAPACISKPVHIVPQSDGWSKPKDPDEALCGTKATDLIDGLRALGNDVAWDIERDSVWRATDGDLTVVIQPYRL